MTINKTELLAVKPLEWIDMGEGPRCITVCGTYAIYPSMSRGSPTLSLSGMPKGLFGKFASIEEAKAAAQADYEQRILSAIDATPIAPVPVTITDEMLRAGVAAAMTHSGMKLKFQVDAILSAALSAKPGEQG